jgi:triosephosphate isomerase
MAQKIVAGNWKMNNNVQEGIALVKELKQKLTTLNLQDVQLIVSPSSISLFAIQEELKGSAIKVSAQNIHAKDSGAYTGEISADMIKAIGIEYTIIGHSERREYFHETSEDIAAKVKKAIEKGITPIYCCGEVKEERESGIHFDVVRKQIENELFGLSVEDFSKVVIAYEPVWAIGTGLTASPEQAQEIHAFIRNLIIKKYSESVAKNTSILYGGSCKPSNAKEIFSKPDVDGGLIGGASLVAEDFLAIANSF